MIILDELTEAQQGELATILADVGKDVKNIEHDAAIVRQAANMQRDLDHTSAKALNNAHIEAREEFTKASDEYRKANEQKVRAESLLHIAEHRSDARDEAIARQGELCAAHPDLFS